MLGDLEDKLGDVRPYNAATAPDNYLPWLASWLAVEPPNGMSPENLRKLLFEAPDLYTRRGTIAGLREFIELYTGIHTLILEVFRERHIWQLGCNSSLGCTTGLVPYSPNGMIVSGKTMMGLMGDYYEGVNFQTLKKTRLDSEINFNWEVSSPIQRQSNSGHFSIRWTGQIQALHSELYIFYIKSDGRVRLWVDGQLIIDNWIGERAVIENKGQITLSAGQWVPITLEYHERTDHAHILLYWSSRSQTREIIPQAQLYSIADGYPSLAHSAQEEFIEGTMLVGKTIVGEAGPLDYVDFGLPLFAETANLFRVMVPPGKANLPGQRDELIRIIETEKPAYTDYELCFIEPFMRVGMQASLGIDSYVAGPPEPMSMSGTQLGFDSFLGEIDGLPGRVGVSTRLDQDMAIGKRRQDGQLRGNSKFNGRAESPRTQQLLLQQDDGRAPVPERTKLRQPKTLASQPFEPGRGNIVRPGSDRPRRHGCCKSGRSN